MSNVATLPTVPLPDSSQLELLKLAILTASPKAALQAIPELLEARGTNAFELGGYLSKIKKEKLYPESMSFDDWMQTQGIRKSKGYALAATFDAIAACKLPPDILARIGWSKLCLIAPLLRSGKSTTKATAHNDKWITEAQLLNQVILRHRVKMEKVKKTSYPTSTGDFVTRTLRLQPDEAETFSKAIEYAKKEAHTEDKGAAAAAIFKWYVDSKAGT